MSTLDDLNQIQEQQQYAYRNYGRASLLDKYRIPIQHFDFEYVMTAKDFKELEQMVDVLRSGQEGYYPDLLRVTENRLRQLKPNSRFLRQTCKVLGKQDLNKDEQDHIMGDLQKWVNDVSRNSKELDDRKTNKIRCDVKIRQCDPQPEPLNLVKNKNEKRISSTDYKAWDKYDPDTELMKQELEEEKMRMEAVKAQKAAEKLQQEAERFVYAGTSSHLPSTSCRLPGTSFQLPSTSSQLPSTSTQLPGTSFQLPSTSFQLPSTSSQLPSSRFQLPSTSFQLPSTSSQLPSSRQAGGTSSANSQFVMGSLDTSKPKKKIRINEYLTEAEAIYFANRELEKGKEYYKNGEYAFAAECFTYSVKCKPSVANLNNRALVFLKLENFSQALKDCNKVLAIDGKNLKALLRKAQALEGLKKYEEALDCVDLLIEKDPNNTHGQELAERVRKYCRNVLKNTRMKIVEIE